MPSGLEGNIISFVRNALYCGYSGKKEVELPGNKKLFLSPRHKFEQFLYEMYIRKRTSIIIDKKIYSLKSYERKFIIILDTETRKNFNLQSKNSDS
jgi:hypothetical protein